MAGLYEERLKWFLRHRQEYAKMVRIFTELDYLAVTKEPTRENVLKFNDLFEKFINFTTDLTFRNDCL